MPKVVVECFLPVWEAKSTPWPAGKLSVKVLRVGYQRVADKSPPCLLLPWGPCALGCRQQSYCAKTKAQSPPEHCSTNHMAHVSCTQVSTVCPLGAEMFKGWGRRKRAAVVQTGGKLAVVKVSWPNHGKKEIYTVVFKYCRNSLFGSNYLAHLCVFFSVLI